MAICALSLLYGSGVESGVIDVEREENATIASAETTATTLVVTEGEQTEDAVENSQSQVR